VIADRIAQLPEAAQRSLQLASLQGAAFVAEVVAELQGLELGALIARLSGALSREHQLIQAQGVNRVETHGPPLAQYQFRHILFQKYLYNRLDPVERSYLHGATGAALARLYGNQTSEISARLAEHFELAGQLDQAVHYRLQAGQRALQLAALEAAETHLTRGLVLLNQLPETTARRQQELTLLLARGAALKASRGYAAPAVQRTYQRAHTLCQEVGEPAQLFPALMSLSTHALVLPNLPQALALGEQMLAVAQQADDTLLTALAHLTLGRVAVHLGRFQTAHQHLTRLIDFYDPQQHHELAYIYSLDLGVDGLAWDAWPLAYLGFLDQAWARSQAALDLARAVEHPLSLAHAHGMAAVCQALRGAVDQAQELAEKTLALAQQYGFVFFQASANYSIGKALAVRGEVAAGLKRLWESLVIYEKLGVGLYHRATLIEIAEFCLQAHDEPQACRVLAEAEQTAVATGERYLEAELQRIKGELRWQQGHAPQEVEQCFRRAIQIAHQQHAKLLELRAGMSLARLLQAQGDRQQAYASLVAVYEWFTEGLDTADLQAARLLLEELAGKPHH
jgi:predicted ATPase